MKNFEGRYPLEVGTLLSDLKQVHQLTVIQETF